MLLVVGIAGTVIAAIILAIPAALYWRLKDLHPLDVQVERRLWTPWFVVFLGPFPGDRGEFEREANLPPADSFKVYDRLRELGAVDFRQSKLHLVLRGNAKRRVLVTNITAHVVNRSEVFTGKIVGAVPQGIQDPAEVVFELDSNELPIPAWPLELDDWGEAHRTGNRRFFEGHSISLTHDESLEVYVFGVSTASYCEWRMHVEMRVGRRKRTMTIDEKGLPFVTSGGDKDWLRHASHWYWNMPGEFLDLGPDGKYVGQEETIQEAIRASGLLASDDKDTEKGNGVE